MKVNQMFPSKYLSAADLQGQSVPVTMDRVIMEQIRSDGGLEDKYVLYFRGKEKGLVLNITNANTIADLYGHETEDWAGRQIILYSTRVQFGSKMVDAIRINRPNSNGNGGQQQSYQGNPDLPPAGNDSDGRSGLDDEIPFAPLRDLP